MRTLMLAAALAVCSVPALAAEPFNIIGTWVPVEHAAAREGDSATYGSTTVPSFVTENSGAWSYNFDQQKGRAFAGLSTGPTGLIEKTVGVFRLDGVRFVLSTTSGGALGEIMGNQIEICWNDNVPNYIAASCTLYKRQ